MQNDGAVFVLLAKQRKKVGKVGLEKPWAVIDKFAAHDVAHDDSSNPDETESRGGG